ncbi:hypothetical protein [Olleya sp. UBA1516]|uniref:hypothetical protein n=1 Tax=Olleya sp. UBA1516 TaxID=1947013 RepID=UPI0025D4B982|nr:hypothetical protein [Olleya sp. UBA1516]|tara:strand:+ start:93296 stop:94126 length:831 start_codon:yes stop_codon:yes gene_type:complete
MKKILLPLLSLAFVFLSCENEPLEGFELDAAGGSTGGGSVGGGEVIIGEPGGETTGDYWPMAEGNKWTYDYSVDGVAEEDSVMEISNQEDYLGFPSYLYSSFFQNSTSTDGSTTGDVELNSYSSKNGGDYHFSVASTNINVGGFIEISQSAYGFIMLKDYLNVGESWTNTYTITTTTEVLIEDLPEVPTTNLNVIYTSQIMEKDSTVEVNGTSYSPVIKVKATTTYQLAGTPDSSAEYFYYFAKDVGLIKYEGSVYDADDNITSNVLGELNDVILN